MSHIPIDIVKGSRTTSSRMLPLLRLIRKMRDPVSRSKSLLVKLRCRKFSIVSRKLSCTVALINYKSVWVFDEVDADVCGRGTIVFECAFGRRGVEVMPVRVRLVPLIGRV